MEYCCFKSPVVEIAYPMMSGDNAGSRMQAVLPDEDGYFETNSCDAIDRHDILLNYCISPAQIFTF